MSIPVRDKPGRSRLPKTLFGAATDGLSATVLFVLMAMTCIDVFGREVLGSPLDGATELTQIMMGFLVFGVLPIISYRNDHVTVDLLDRFFPRQLLPARSCILSLIGGIVMTVVCWRVWIIGSYQMDYGDATEFLAIPLGPVSYFIALMSGITAIALFTNACRRARDQEPASSSLSST